MSKLDIVELRNKLGISQEKLAEMIGVSLRTIQNYEAGGKIPKSKNAILRKLIDGGLQGTADPLRNNLPDPGISNDVFEKKLCEMFRNEEIFPASVVHKKNDLIHGLYEEIGGLKARIRDLEIIREKYQELLRDQDQKRVSSA